MAIANGRNYFFQKGTQSTYDAKAAMEQCLTDILELWPKEVWPVSTQALIPWITSLQRLPMGCKQTPYNIAASLMAMILGVAYLMMDTVANRFWREA